MSSEEDDTVGILVDHKWLRFGHGHPDEEGSVLGWTIDITQDGVELHDIVVEETDLTEEDVASETGVGDLPMPEIATAFQRQVYGKLTRTFVWLDGELQTRDEENDVDAGEVGSYLAPTEFFGHIEPGETHRFRVGQPGDYYPIRRDGRAIDILH